MREGSVLRARERPRRGRGRHQNPFVLSVRAVQRANRRFRNRDRFPFRHSLTTMTSSNLDRSLNRLYASRRGLRPRDQVCRNQRQKPPRFHRWQGCRSPEAPVGHQSREPPSRVQSQTLPERNRRNPTIPVKTSSGMRWIHRCNSARFARVLTSNRQRRCV